MPIFFPDFLRPKLERQNPKGGTYWGALTRLVDLYDQSPPNWVTEKEVSEIARLRQLDKSEPAITYYLFAALAEATNGFADAGQVSELLANAFPAEVASEVGHQIALHGVAGLEFEGQIAPNGALREEVKRRVSACPVAYARSIAGIGGRKGVRFESATRLDCFIGDRRALGEDAERAPGTFGLGVEAKFTSDIDDETTYSPHRNQIARILEVGHQRCEQFIFLLIAPRSYRQARSRLYVYKMEEYQSDAGVAALRRDILLPQPDDVLRGWLRNMGWLDWEHVVEFLYSAGQPRPGWRSVFSEPLRTLLVDRRLWPF
jgi:hypothetical protein